MQLVVKGMDKVIPHSRLPEAGSIVNSLAASGVSLSERGVPSPRFLSFARVLLSGSQVAARGGGLSRGAAFYCVVIA